jgi:hypothetical protein
VIIEKHIHEHHQPIIHEKHQTLIEEVHVPILHEAHSYATDKQERGVVTEEIYEKAVVTETHERPIVTEVVEQTIIETDAQHQHHGKGHIDGIESHHSTHAHSL